MTILKLSNKWMLLTLRLAFQWLKLFKTKGCKPQDKDKPIPARVVLLISASSQKQLAKGGSLREKLTPGWYKILTSCD